MKRNKKSIKVIFLSVFIALVVIAIAGMNMRTLINSNGVTRIARKAGANDAIAQDVLENYTFTSDTAGINQEGTIKDYSEYEGRFKLLATAAPESKIYNLTLSPGYYTHINVDATDVYNEGYDDGYDNGHDKGVEDTAKTWVYDHATQTVTKGKVTLNIGDIVNYTAPASSGYTGAWQVLGVDRYRAIKINFREFCTD